jgi:hypothetical protein
LNISLFRGKHFSNFLPANCQYKVNNGPAKDYQTIRNEAGPDQHEIWCSEKKTIDVTVKTSGEVSGKTMTSDHCADAIVDIIACSSDNALQILHDNYANSTIKRHEIERRSPVNTKSGDPPDIFLSNFESSSPPGPITHAPNTHYFTVEGQQDTTTPYSVLFDGNRGVPVYVGYKLTNANMDAIVTTKTLLRNKWTKLSMDFNI